MTLKFEQQIEEFKSTINYLKDNQENANLEKSNHMMMIEQRNEQYFNEINKLKAHMMEVNR